jgi:hypothetical protein
MRRTPAGGATGFSVADGTLTASGFQTDSAGRSGFFKTTSSTAHAVTVYQAATSGVDAAAAMNVVSDNVDSSAMYLSGTEYNRGTLKVTHRKPAASDANAAAISIDLQGSGTSAQGIYITSTEVGGTTGNLVTVRHNGRDDFVVKSTGRVGFGLGIGSTPAGVIEVKQNDTTSVGFAMTAIASGSQMVLLKDSGGNARLEVNASGNLIGRATAFFTTSVQIGSATADMGGGTGVISIKDRGTAPTTNPTGGGILYVENGSLKFRGSAGTVTSVAPA